MFVCVPECLTAFAENYDDSLKNEISQNMDAIEMALMRIPAFCIRVDRIRYSLLAKCARVESTSNSIECFRCYDDDCTHSAVARAKLLLLFSMDVRYH